jgi:hypothetical protein
MLTSVGYFGSLPYLFVSTLLDLHFYLMKVLEITLTLTHNLQYIIFGGIVTYRVIFGNSSYIDLQPRNARTVAIHIKLHFFIGIVL